MSVATWTHIDLASECAAGALAGWRMVEAQHRVATMQLVGGDTAAQATLEHILDEWKPRVPPEAEGLHWLLATPFRYDPPQGGSRFRREHEPGVFYGAADRATACAESGYWRLRFWCDSDALIRRTKSVPVTLFEFSACAVRAIDLRADPFLQHRALWTHPADYGQTQALAAAARDAGIDLIRYESVRRPGGLCFAILSPEVFRRVADAYANVQQGWTLYLQPPDRIVLRRDLTDETFEFHWT